MKSSSADIVRHLPCVVAVAVVAHFVVDVIAILLDPWTLVVTSLDALHISPIAVTRAVDEQALLLLRLESPVGILAARELGAGRDARAVNEATDAVDLVGQLLSDIFGVGVGVVGGAAMQMAEFEVAVVFVEEVHVAVGVAACICSGKREGERESAGREGGPRVHRHEGVWNVALVERA